MPNLAQLRKLVKKLADPQKAKVALWFFKTKPGHYGYGDKFLGLVVPKSRAIAKQFKELPLTDVKKLLDSAFHEERLIALFILVLKFEKGDASLREKIYKFYLQNIKRVNNWDLVDSSAYQILGAYLWDRPKSILAKLARSKNLWERRIAIIATLYFIRKHRFKEALQIAAMLLGDKEDLIHKAVGWMLREIGERSKVVEENFLKKYYKKMPRTSLRYAIEKFPESIRKKYLQGKI